MRLACPSCAAAYEIPDRMLTAGRPLRCARCGHQWAYQAPAGEPGLAPATEAPVIGTPAIGASAIGASDTGPPSPPIRAQAAPADADRPAPEPPPEGPTAFAAMDRLGLTSKPAPETGRAALRAAWAASILVLILAAAAGYTWRDGLMQAWPPSQRVYAALGLPVAQATTEVPAGVPSGAPTERAQAGH